MPNIQYVLRANCFGYNDECFFVSGTRIQQIFDHPEAAQAALKQCELDHARMFSLHETACFFDADDQFLADMDAFVFERCGVHILDNGDVIQDTLPAALNDLDTFEFIQRANMNSHQIITFAPDARCYALWLNRRQKFLLRYDEDFSSLIYHESAEHLITHYSEDIFYQERYDAMLLQGTLADLSDSPLLLSALLADHKHLKYNPKTQQLSFKKNKPETLVALNALLKQPLFECRALSLTDIMNIECQLNHDPYGIAE
jgi:hypothetical protein